jgi:RNase adapter protein RapZ
VHRFSETRRRHPLSAAGADTSQRSALITAIERERTLLQDLRDMAMVVDTSRLRTAKLQSTLNDIINTETSPGGSSGLTLVFESFGFKRGIPIDADFVFDVRMLPNPHYEPELKALTGRDAPVAQFLAAQPAVADMEHHISEFLLRWLPDLRKDHRAYVTVAIGCTGGQHRSVYLVEQLTERFAKPWQPIKRHRELG